MSTKDVSRAAAKRAREELKRVQYEKRLESEQRLEAVRRRGRRVMRTGFGFIAFGFCSSILEISSPASPAKVIACPTVNSF